MKVFRWILLVVFLILVAYNVYSGMVIKKVGIPGIAMLEFQKKADNTDLSKPASSRGISKASDANRSADVIINQETSGNQSPTAIGEEVTIEFNKK